MHARVPTAAVQPGKMDDIIAVSRESGLPAAQQQRGFKGALWLTERDTNKLSWR